MKRQMKSLLISRGNPYMTMVWLMILGSVLLFFFITYQFLLRAEGMDWMAVRMPKAFSYSTPVLILSSASLFFANQSFRKEGYSQSFFWLSITLTLASAFFLLQIAGWISMVRNGITLKNTAGAFVYLVSGLHFLHFVPCFSGLCLIWWDSLSDRTYVEGFLHSQNPAKMTRWRMVSLFWHFLGVLWMFLFALLWFRQP
jgi:cytochrome c oxidase subunit 3